MQIILDLASEALNKDSCEFRAFNSLLCSLQFSVLENHSSIYMKESWLIYLTANSRILCLYYKAFGIADLHYKDSVHLAVS